jgi:phosphoglycerol geranylgeranyltransferase
MIGPTARYLQERTTKGRRAHLTLLDPASVPPQVGVDIARRAKEFGTDAFMVGGSTGITEANLDALVQGIKSATSLPVIHFPNHHGAISRHVDGIWFMSMLNSRDPRFITREQMLGAPILKALRIEPLSLGYIIVAPGMTVGRVSDAEVIPRTPEGAEMAAAYALAAQFLGMQFVYLEAGSGAGEPVPLEHVRAAREATADIKLIVGGGIRTAAQAKALLQAGADMLVTGTIAEEQAYTALHGIVKAVREHPA